MAAPIIRLLLRVGIYCIIAVHAIDDKYSEELFLKQNNNGYVHSHFRFTTKWHVETDNVGNFDHYRLFPRKLGEVLHEYMVQELHLSLTQGLWKYSRWGLPLEDAAPGAELWVWFKKDTQNIDSNWKGLVNALSGMLCASLNFIDEKLSVQPKFSFRPQGLVDGDHSANNSFVRYAALPNERVCTENLTPWKKLLPCGAKTGLATLLRAQNLLDSHYHSLAIHVRPMCWDESCMDAALELQQTLSSVFEPVLHSSRRTHDWSLQTLFGKPLGARCALASPDSRVLVDVSHVAAQTDHFTLQPDPVKTADINGRLHAVYELVEGLSISLTHKHPVVYSSPLMPTPISAHRIVTGYGLESGGIRCQLFNSLPWPVTIVYMEVIPWFLRLYYHTLVIKSQGKTIVPKKIHYIPGRDRERPYHLEVVFDLPANSSTSVSMQFDRLLLKWTEYPPDANHGFYVPSAVISALVPQCSIMSGACRNSSNVPSADERVFVRLHTESLLLALPTPDFSMPYNVICLACTVLAVAFGSFHNLTTKYFAARPKGSKGHLSVAVAYVQRVLRWKVADNLQGKGTADGQDNIAGRAGNEESSETKSEIFSGAAREGSHSDIDEH